MTDFLIATNNGHKVEEFKRILLPLGIKVLSAKEAGIDLGDVVEDGTTFADNAKIKAVSAFRKSGLPSIADDSGLCVDALSGAPGIYSARFGGEDISQFERNALLLKEMIKSGNDIRTARFVSSICCVFTEDDIITLEGVCEGTIAEAPCGEGGFGYDPLFIYEDGRCFGAIDGDEKDEVSHRGRALRALRDELIKRKDVL